jgi:membrane protein implicated in regulation of membrane protease activity
LRRQVREREKPEPSVVWQTLGVAFAGFAFASGLAALTISVRLAVRPVDFWIATAGFVLAAVLCFAAHRDVNRGRRSRWIELEELPPTDRR